MSLLPATTSEENFVIKVGREETMQIEMAQQLQQNMHSWRAEFHRPINVKTSAKLCGNGWAAVNKRMANTTALSEDGLL